MKCVSGKVHMEALTSAGLNNPFFHQSSQSSGNTPRLKDYSVLSKMPGRSGHLTNKGHAC